MLHNVLLGHRLAARHGDMKGCALSIHQGGNESGPPWESLPCNCSWVMVHRRPDRQDANMTSMKPCRSKEVSPNTSSVRPMLMMPTTPARLQLGLCMQA